MAREIKRIKVENTAFKLEERIFEPGCIIEFPFSEELVISSVFPAAGSGGQEITTISKTTENEFIMTDYFSGDPVQRLYQRKGSKLIKSGDKKYTELYAEWFKAFNKGSLI
ncbi:MAG: hypothetical protein Q8N63_06080 [Nanoarchaeota archaeon]|nr:hypothetical protein [Nanoarchaeota archaeon]